MNIRLHKKALATPAIRQEIRASTAPIRTLAREYGLDRATVKNGNLEQTFKCYERIYNQPIPQKALGHIAPIHALKNWQETHP